MRISWFWLYYRLEIYVRQKYPLLPHQESLKQIRKHILGSEYTVLYILNII